MVVSQVKTLISGGGLDSSPESSSEVNADDKGSFCDSETMSRVCEGDFSKNIYNPCNAGSTSSEKVQPSGEKATKRISLDSFSKINSLLDTFNLYIRSSTDSYAKISGDKNFINLIEMEVRDDTLYVYEKCNTGLNCWNTPILNACNVIIDVIIINCKNVIII